MNLYRYQRAYFNKQQDIIDDPFKNKELILFENNKIQILSKQKKSYGWKYSLAFEINQKIAYVVFKIIQNVRKQLRNNENFIVIAQINTNFLQNYQKNLFLSLKQTQILQVIQSISKLIGSSIKCEIKIAQNQQKKLCLTYTLSELYQGFESSIIKLLHLMVELILSRLKILVKIKKNKQASKFSRIKTLRNATVSLTQQHNNQQASDRYFNMRQQQFRIKKYCHFIQSKYQNTQYNPNLISQQFKQQKQLQKSLQYQKTIHTKSIKKKVLKNIQVINTERSQKYSQTKFTILTKCIKIYKPLSTHINRRGKFQNSQDNIQYYNKMVDLTPERSGLFMKKQPNIVSINTDQQIVKRNRKAVRLFKNQLSSLQILKDLQSENICEYFVNGNQKNAIYSRLHKYSLLNLEQCLQQMNIKTSQSMILDLLIQILNSLKQISSHGLIHRDLKLQNILIDINNQNGNIILKLIDFGSAIYSYLSKNQDQNQIKTLFLPKLRTTQFYSMKYSTAKILLPELKRKFDQKSYNRHQNFDLYSFGTIVKLFLPQLKKFNNNPKNQHLLNNLQFLSSVCRQLNPDNRITIKNATQFLKELKNTYPQN